VSPALVQRTVALAAVALVAAVGAVALASDGDESTTAAGPRAVPAPGGGWYTALAGSRGPSSEGERTTCRLIVRGRSLGVTHPALPCGAKIYIEYDGTELLTEVIDNRLKQPGRVFELTELLAQRLGLDGTQEIRWRYAASPAR
jgi:hypothetical protein